MAESRYISTTETAKLIRKALKAAFPGQKFSVRSSSYAGGSSIRVNWTDGPTKRQVEAICGNFEGKGFDGMIDMQYYYSHWLMPDGSVTIAHTSGTEGSRGNVPAINNPAPHPKAELVQFGNSFLFCDRDVSEAFIERIKSDFARITPDQRAKLFFKLEADRGLSPYQRPDSWSFEDPTLPDFGDYAKTVFRTMAHNLEAA